MVRKEGYKDRQMGSVGKGDERGERKEVARLKNDELHLPCMV